MRATIEVVHAGLAAMDLDGIPYEVRKSAHDSGFTVVGVLLGSGGKGIYIASYLTFVAALAWALDMLEHHVEPGTKQTVSL